MPKREPRMACRSATLFVPSCQSPTPGSRTTWTNPCRSRARRAVRAWRTATLKAVPFSQG
eukprot:1567669-Prymnesium_polylepis.1